MVSLRRAERRMEEDDEGDSITDVGDGIAMARVLVAKARKAVTREDLMMEDVQMDVTWF